MFYKCLFTGRLEGEIPKYSGVVYSRLTYRVTRPLCLPPYSGAPYKGPKLNHTVGHYTGVPVPYSGPYRKTHSTLHP